MLLFAGDPHGYFEHLYPFIQNNTPISLIILGDLQLTDCKELDKLAQYCDLWFIHGNHDSKTVAAFEALWGSKWQQRNLHGRVAEIEGIKIAGLGGVFRGQIWMPPNKPLFFDPIHYCQYCTQDKIWRGGLPLRHRTSIFPSDIDTLATQQADILICHEAPKPHPSGFAAINQLAESMGVKKIFHGHHHDNFDYTQLKSRIRPYQIFNIGFRSLSDINGNYLLIGIDDR
ncbi:metallophosphoesterase [Gallibacterium trehalosifermentans]|uniref:Metallophosphoesterase n=1 Tax=Gallibacterium trehalosifermentans TaxID=516935 RepID=A0ABV6GZG6_9PAST